MSLVTNFSLLNLMGLIDPRKIVQKSVSSNTVRKVIRDTYIYKRYYYKTFKLNSVFHKTLESTNMVEMFNFIGFYNSIYLHHQKQIFDDKVKLEDIVFLNIDNRLADKLLDNFARYSGSNAFDGTFEASLVVGLWNLKLGKTNSDALLVMKYFSELIGDIIYYTNTPKIYDRITKPKQI